VVDAGGYGVTIIFAGIIAALRGAEPPELEHHAPARPSHPQHESSTYRYCINFAVTGSELDPNRYARDLEQLGDSVLVVGDRITLKVHVHTDTPEQATALFEGVGEVSHLDVADMRQQIGARSERLAAAAATNGDRAEGPVPVCAVLAVVSGPGMRRLYEEIGAHALDGGPTLNPSTYDLLAGVHAVAAEQVVVLPNSPNVIMAADKAADLSDKQVCVVRSRSQQAGLAAALALDPNRGAAENSVAMEDALGQVRTGAVARAARDDGQGRFAAGEAVGYVEEELVAWGGPESTLGVVLGQLADDAELLTCIEGAGAPLSVASVRRLVPEGVELEVSEGGQPSWWWLISAE
jgi:uncharacterized protein